MSLTRPSLTHPASGWFHAWGAAVHLVWILGSHSLRGFTGCGERHRAFRKRAFPSLLPPEGWSSQPPETLVLALFSQFPLHLVWGFLLLPGWPLSWLSAAETHCPHGALPLFLERSSPRRAPAPRVQQAASHPPLGLLCLRGLPVAGPARQASSPASVDASPAQRVQERPLFSASFCYLIFFFNI